MLGQLRRRWASIGPALVQHLVFAGSVDKPHSVSHIAVVQKWNNKFRGVKTPSTDGFLSFENILMEKINVFPAGSISVDYF